MEEVESDSPGSRPVRWAAWRIDDNGNTIVVREHLDRAEAERLVVAFTARGHKQMYWAKQETTRAEPLSQGLRLRLIGLRVRRPQAASTLRRLRGRFALRACRTIRQCAMAGRFEMRREHGGDGSALLGRQATVAHQANLVQPRSAPLQRSVGNRNLRLERHERRRLTAASVFPSTTAAPISEKPAMMHHLLRHPRA
jgi:hypothetical protein